MGEVYANQPTLLQYEWEKVWVYANQPTLLCMGERELNIHKQHNYEAFVWFFLHTTGTLQQFF